MTNDLHFRYFPQLESEQLIFRKFSLNDTSDIQAIRSMIKL